MSPSEKAKAEVEGAILDVRDSLKDPVEITGLRRVQLAATLDYALTQLAEVQAVKKARKAAAPA
jgi:hypothetical protein